MLFLKIITNLLFLSIYNHIFIKRETKSYNPTEELTCPNCKVAANGERVTEYDILTCLIKGLKYQENWVLG